MKGQPRAMTGRAVGTIRRRALSLVFALATMAPSLAWAQAVLPDVITRNADGSVIVRATRLQEPIKIDGRLDEELYRTTPMIGGFIQQDPHEGEAASEATDVWMFFDEKSIYVSVRCWDSHPERIIANEMRRDSRNIFSNDNFAIAFDTFHDKRNALVFEINPLGGLYDLAVTDERDNNPDWNTVWSVRATRFEKGWTMEMAVPFKSLRFNPGTDQVWGVQMRRVVRWKNEVSFLTHVPAHLGTSGLFSSSLGATLVGLEVPATHRNLEVLPYVISGSRTDVTATPAVSNDWDRNAGLDVKLGVTKGLTADLTYNTDFAQVEDDVQQANLTRFSLFFPEKREFFLEGQGLFAFGGTGVNSSTTTATPIMFFSRRIGLNNGRPVPIRAGGRLTGRAGRYAIGILNIESEDDDASAAVATNFTAIRVKRDFLRQSYFGALYTRRSVATLGAGTGETFGIDALYSPSPRLRVNTYVARTRTEGLAGKDASYDVKFDYNTDRYQGTIDRNYVGKQFNPELGFLSRRDFSRNYVLLRFSPRPARSHMKAIRKFNYQASLDRFVNDAGRLDTQDLLGEFAIDFQSSDRLAIDYKNGREFIPSPFAIVPAVKVPIGGYHSQSVLASYTVGPQHAAAGVVSFEAGELYEGTKKILTVSSARIGVTPQLAIEPGVSVNRVDLPWGAFTAQVISARTTITWTPRAFVSALTQFNSTSHILTSNVRFRWEYQPGSELFLVYSDGRDTAVTQAFPRVLNRALLFKITRLFQL